ncbi:MAG: hypothetical protein HY898_02485 [Deltaproteobacteria bacterium]|nr:hypothetical protein [Deltaproteobacteria bacterium]
MPRGIISSAALWALGLLIAACSSQPSTPLAAPNVAASARTPSATLPSGWDYHPKAPAGLRTRLTFEDGRWLFAGARGERWLADPREATAASASMLADEDLVAILRSQQGDYTFVGSNGTLYVSKQPLGLFTEVVRPARKLTHVVGRGATLLGVPEAGGLVRSSDGGRTFQPVAFEGGRIFDMAVASDGRALILSAPEQLWESTDGGTTFKLSASKTIGAMSAEVDASGDLVARGLLRSVAWRKGAPSMQPLPGPVEAPDYDLMTDPKPGPSGAALNAGSATLQGTRYLEAVAPKKPGSPWTLITSELLGRATVDTSIPGTSECARMLVAASRELVVLGCLVGSKSGQALMMPTLKLFVSNDGGMTFESKLAGLVADERRARMRLLPSGTLLLTGACRPVTRRLCQVSAPVRVAVSRGRTSLHLGEVETAKAPMAPVQAIGVEVSPDGKRIYWAGRLAAGRALAMFVSDDEGATFKPIVLEPNRLGLGSADEARSLFETSQPDELGMDEQGNVSLTLTMPNGRMWLVFDREGRVGSSRILPPESPMIAAAGRHALVFGAKDGAVQVSHDGGGAFEKLGTLPMDAQVEAGQSVVACRAVGCAMGSAFSWQGWTSAPGGRIESPQAKEQAAPAKLLTPIVCKVPQGPWHQLPRVERPVTAFDADRGGTAWSAIVREHKRGAVSFVAARSTPKPHVDTIQVLQPAATDDVALVTSSQAEGMAALRYPIERDSDGELKFGRPLRNIEVGWVNLYDAGVKRAKLAESGTLGPEDAAGWRPGEEVTANAAILSVSMGGIYVCPHASCEGSDKLGAFLDLAGQAHPISVPKWPTFVFSGQHLSARGDIIRVEGKDVPLAFLQETLALARAHRAEGGFRFDAMTFLPESARQDKFRVQFSWAFMEGTHVNALSVTLVHPTEPAAYARILQFRAADEGVATVIPAPLLSEAGDPPRACTPADRKSSYRIVAPTSGGRRHPIRIDGATDKPMWLLSDDAVVFGRAGAACVSMLGTVNVGPESTSTSALIDVANLQASWLFEFDPSESGLQWRSMQCAFDPSVRPPPSVMADKADEAPATATIGLGRITTHP